MGSGVGIPQNVVRDGDRQHNIACNCCSKPIAGTRWKEKSVDFNLCDMCYTQREGVVDNSKLVPIFVSPLRFSSKNNLTATSRLTPRKVISDGNAPLQDRLSYSSIISRLPRDVVERERKSKTELITSCPATLEKDFNKFLGVFPAYSFPHEFDDELYNLTEGSEWKLYKDGPKHLKYYLDMTNDLMGTLNVLMLERSYPNLARFRVLVGFCIPQAEVPKWLTVFSSRWELQLHHEGAESKRIEDNDVSELSRRQFFSNRCIPLNYRMQNIPGGGGMKSSTLPGFMEVKFSNLAMQNPGKDFYARHLIDQGKKWFQGNIFANSEYAAQFEFASPLAGQAELECKFNKNFPHAKKFVQIIEPLIGSYGCDVQTAINYGIIATAKVVKEVVDAMMDAGMKRILKISPAIRLTKIPTVDSSAMEVRGRERWENSQCKEGSLSLLDTIKYTLELVSFSDSLRVSDLLRQKVFKDHFHLDTAVDMSALDFNHVTMTFGIRLATVASYFPFFSEKELLGEIDPNQFMCVQVQLLSKESVILLKYREQLKELSNSTFLQTDSVVRNLSLHLEEIAKLSVQNRRSFFSQKSDSEMSKESVSAKNMFKSSSKSGSGSFQNMQSIKEDA